jgi:hypothetical protein
MDGTRGSPVTVTATKKTMSRSFLIDSLIGGVKHPIAGAATAAAVPYHPQLNEYIQFLNRTAAAAAAYGGYQSPASVVFPSSPSAIAAGPRIFGYPVVSGGGGSGIARDQQHHHKHQPVVKPVAVVATGHRTKHAKTSTAKKRNVDEMMSYGSPGKLTTLKILCLDRPFPVTLIRHRKVNYFFFTHVRSNLRVNR